MCPREQIGSVGCPSEAAVNRVSSESGASCLRVGREPTARRGASPKPQMQAASSFPTTKEGCSVLLVVQALWHMRAVHKDRQIFIPFEIVSIFSTAADTLVVGGMKT